MIDKTKIGYLFDETLKTYKEKFFLFATILLFFQFIPLTLYNIYSTLNPISLETGLGAILIQIMILIILVLISFVGNVAILYVLLKNKKITTINEALTGAKNYYLPALGVSLLIFVMIVPLFILLIIPGLIFSIYWMFAQYIVIDNDEKVTKSISKSMDIVKGNWWGVFGRFLLAMLIVFAILFSVTLVLGLILLIGTGPAILTTGVNSGLELSLTIINNAIQILVSIFIIIYSTQLYIGYRDKYQNETKTETKTKTEIKTVKKTKK